MTFTFVRASRYSESRNRIAGKVYTRAIVMREEETALCSSMIDVTR